MGAVRRGFSFVVSLTLLTVSTVVAQTNSRVSVSGGGMQATSVSNSADLTPDGRYVVFASNATNLTAEARPGVFRHDRSTGATVFVGPGSDPSISDDGQAVAFTSTADTLVPNDTNGVPDVFVWSALDGSYERVNVVEGSQFVGTQGRISGNGRFVTYVTSPGVTGQNRIYDRVLQTTSIVSDDAKPAEVSADGRYAAFTSVHFEATGTPNGRQHVYRLDRQTGQTVVVTATSTGELGAGDSDLASMSDDGRYVAFHSLSANFPGTRSPGLFDLFVKDLDTGAIEQINLNGSGTRIATTFGFLMARISVTGRFVAFSSASPHVLPGDALGMLDAFLLDRTNGSIAYVSRSQTGAEAAGGSSTRPVPSADGRVVAFESTAHNIVPGDTNFDSDVFVRDMAGTPPCQVTVSPAGLAVLTRDGGNSAISVTAASGCAWTASVNAPWLHLTGTVSGSGNGTVPFGFEPYFGGARIRNGAIVVNDAAYGVRQLPETTQRPLGVWETPAPPPFAPPLSGAVPFTGWALDDVQVTRIRINRLPVDGEGSGEIYIGDAVKVAGARPDVAGASTSSPYNTEAGWGLMVLTNMLPNQGNGTFTFRVHFDDADGHTVSSSRTLTVDNANSTVPFGTIDTPAQGQTVSGTIVNFGWALTPQPGVIPSDGSTIDVYIDGVNVGKPSYGGFRSDIATLFPGYANSDGAVGNFTLDTTQYGDGMHTIAWVVTDNLGRASGIGSRYFWIQNGPHASVPAYQRRK